MSVWAVFPFSSQSVTTATAVTSSPFFTGEGRICGFDYQLSTATSGVYVSATATLLVAADSSSTYVLPVDSANAANNVLAININSNNRYVSYRFDDLPVAPWAQVRISSVLNTGAGSGTTITFNSVRLLYTDN